MSIMTQWHAIDDPERPAPKDGTEVLCFSPGLFLGQMVLYWMDGYWREKANGMGLKSPPTHWMPLPPPPKDEGK